MKVTTVEDDKERERKNKEIQRAKHQKDRQMEDEGSRRRQRKRESKNEQGDVRKREEMKTERRQKNWAVVVAQLAEQSLLIPDDLGLNPVIGNVY